MRFCLSPPRTTSIATPPLPLRARRTSGSSFIPSTSNLPSASLATQRADSLAIRSPASSFTGDGNGPAGYRLTSDEYGFRVICQIQTDDFSTGAPASSTTIPRTVGSTSRAGDTGSGVRSLSRRRCGRRSPTPRPASASCRRKSPSRGAVSSRESPLRPPLPWIGLGCVGPPARSTQTSATHAAMPPTTRADFLTCRMVVVVPWRRHSAAHPAGTLPPNPVVGSSTHPSGHASGTPNSDRLTCTDKFTDRDTLSHRATRAGAPRSTWARRLPTTRRASTRRGPRGGRRLPPPRRAG